MSTANPAIDPLTTCANEPIRIPGAIQPHGALALFRESELVLIQGSANLGTTLRKDVRCDGSQKLDGICGAECGNAIRDWMSGGEGHYLRNHMLAGVNFSVSGHRTRQG